MLSKLAGFVLAGSLAALTIGGIAEVAGYDVYNGRDRHRDRRHVERRIERRIEQRISRHVERGEHHRVRDYGEAEGTYVFDATGDVLGKFPWSAHVELSLRDNGRYELRVKTNVDGTTETETSWGRYRLDGDRIKLYSGDDSHEMLINGDRLEFEAGFKEKLALKAVGIGDAAFTKLKE